MASPPWGSDSTVSAQPVFVRTVRAYPGQAANFSKNFISFHISAKYPRGGLPQAGCRTFSEGNRLP